MGLLFWTEVKVCSVCCDERVEAYQQQINPSLGRVHLHQEASRVVHYS